MASNPAPVRRTTSGAVFGAYLRWLEKHGLKEQVRALVGADAARLADTPPVASERIDARLADEWAAALARLRGLDAVRTLGYEAMRDSWLPVLQPLVDDLVSTQGKRPESLLSRMHSIGGPLVAGSTLAFVARGPQRGEFAVRYEHPATAAAFALWEGVVRALCEAYGTALTVEPAVVGEGGRSARMQLSWRA